MKVTLSRHAKADLEDIRNYTIENWGSHQWLLYYRRLSHAFEQINKHTVIGKDRSLLLPGMRSLNCQRHVIFFKRFDVVDNRPVILRIIHQRRNMPALVYYEDLEGV